MFIGGCEQANAKLQDLACESIRGPVGK